MVGCGRVRHNTGATVTLTIVFDLIESYLAAMKEVRVKIAVGGSQ